MAPTELSTEISIPILVSDTIGKKFFELVSEDGKNRFFIDYIEFRDWYNLFYDTPLLRNELQDDPLAVQLYRKDTLIFERKTTSNTYHDINIELNWPAAPDKETSFTTVESINPHMFSSGDVIYIVKRYHFSEKIASVYTRSNFSKKELTQRGREHFYKNFLKKLPSFVSSNKDITILIEPNR